MPEQPGAKLKADLTPLDKVTKALENGDPEVSAIFKKWIVRYSAFVRRQFLINSRGGGDWPDLALSTKIGRAQKAAAKKQVKVTGKGKNRKVSVVKPPRKGSEGGVKNTNTNETPPKKLTKKEQKKWAEKIKGRKFAILRDTGVLFNALSIGANGNYVKGHKNFVEFGFAKTKHGGDEFTIRDIAVTHDLGAGRVPKREILRTPTKEVIASMLNDAGHGSKRLLKKFAFTKTTPASK